MTVPSDHTSLNTETDRLYYAREPNAPGILDPNDPSHRAWIDEWLTIRDEVLVDATNHHFFEQHPDAPPRLDPSDSSQTHFVNEWIRIRDEIMGDGVTGGEAPEQPAATEPPIDEFDTAATAVRDQLTYLLGLDNATIDSPAGKHIVEQLDIGRSMYLGHHFDHHDEWTSPTHSFDGAIGFNDLGVQVRVVGPTRSVRVGLVGNGPSDVGGWESYRGAPTQ